MKTEVIRARIPETLKKDFEATAAAHGWTLSHAIRNLINQYVAQEKKMNRRHLETIEAIEDIETGRVVDGENVLDWLYSWGTDNELYPPK